MLNKKASLTGRPPILSSGLSANKQLTSYPVPNPQYTNVMDSGLGHGMKSIIETRIGTCTYKSVIHGLNDYIYSDYIARRCTARGRPAVRERASTSDPGSLKNVIVCGQMPILSYRAIDICHAWRYWRMHYACVVCSNPIVVARPSRARNVLAVTRRRAHSLTLT
jgi:hypothetical protein